MNALLSLLNGDSLLLHYIEAILILFIIMDPLGNAPLFYSYTARFSRDLRRKIIVKSIMIAAGLLLFFGLFGEPFFKIFGVTLSDFRIAGGIILFIYGLSGLLGKSEIERITEPEALAVVPLATPLLAGPGAIATIIYTKYNWGLEVTVVSVAVNTLLALFFLLLGERILQLLGKEGSIFLVRLFSMLLAAIAVSMVRQGITEIVTGG